MTNFKGIDVTSEIKKLNKVMLHRPGKELENLTPDTLPELLFDDIPFLKVAQEEHDAFAQILTNQGAEVVYLEDLMAETLDAHPEIKDEFLRKWIKEAGIYTPLWTEKVYNWLTENYKNNKDLVVKTMEGIQLKEIGADGSTSLVDLISEPSKLIADPMPNLYFTRDPFGSIGCGASLNQMRFPTRNRETIYADYIFKFHPDFAGVADHLYTKRTDKFYIEGGDILNLNATTLAIGISQRTCADAIENLARNIFADKDATINKVLAFNIPVCRAFMHLDTVFTQLDYDKFSIHPGIMGPLEVFEITPGAQEGELAVKRMEGTPDVILANALGIDHVELIKCGGDDMIAADREQWNDGSNTLAIAPGEVVVYERNEVTNALLKEYGVKLHVMPSAELSRGRGGPRCMSMPLNRNK